MLLDERGRLVFMMVGTGSKMFGSGRRGSFENVYTIVYLVSCLRGVILISSESQATRIKEGKDSSIEWD